MPCVPHSSSPRLQISLIPETLYLIYKNLRSSDICPRLKAYNCVPVPSYLLLGEVPLVLRGRWPHFIEVRLGWIWRMGQSNIQGSESVLNKMRPPLVDILGPIAGPV